MNAQVAIALERANDVRLKRARLRAEIAGQPPHEGAGIAAAVIERPPPCAATWTAAKLATAIRMVGPHSAKTALHRAGVSEFATLEKLTDRQRQALGDELRRLGHHPWKGRP